MAKAAGVSPDTIRHYERIGVLPRALRTESGYRVFPPTAVERVLVVQRALRIGFTLDELAEVLKVRDAGGVPRNRVYQLTQDKLQGIAEDIGALSVQNDQESVVRLGKANSASRCGAEITPSPLAH